VTTIGVPVRPRSGGRPASAVAELALPALTVVSGLQLLRLMVSTVVGVYRDRFGAPLVNLALFAILVVGLGFLAGPAARLLGRRRFLVVSAAGVAGVRLILQLVPEAVARRLLAAAGWRCSCGSCRPGWPGGPGRRHGHRPGPRGPPAGRGGRPGRPGRGRRPGRGGGGRRLRPRPGRGRRAGGGHRPPGHRAGGGGRPGPGGGGGRLDGRHGAVRAAGPGLLRRLRRGPAGRQRVRAGAGGGPAGPGRRRGHGRSGPARRCGPARAGPRGCGNPPPPPGHLGYPPDRGSRQRWGSPGRGHPSGRGCRDR
jgi:hypothetical protein